MADLKSIANMQIGGPKYPKKRRINLYQKQTKKGKIAAELGAFAVFMVFVYGFSRFGIFLLPQPFTTPYSAPHHAKKQTVQLMSHHIRHTACFHFYLNKDLFFFVTIPIVF